uniref:Uncharacterized protein n=1 Tax=Oryza meridionalis TaxID=40149 RepID=A0A0E0DNT7_9ORYZ
MPHLIPCPCKQLATTQASNPTMQEDQGFGSLKSLRPDRTRCVLVCFAYILQMGCYRLSGISIQEPIMFCTANYYFLYYLRLPNNVRETLVVLQNLSSRHRSEKSDGFGVAPLVLISYHSSTNDHQHCKVGAEQAF